MLRKRQNADYDEPSVSSKPPLSPEYLAFIFYNIRRTPLPMEDLSYSFRAPSQIYGAIGCFIPERPPLEALPNRIGGNRQALNSVSGRAN